MLMCDFESCFCDDQWSRFYIFIYSLLLYCTLLMVAFVQKYPLPKFVVIAVLHLLFFCYLMLKKPFISRWNNFRSIVNQIVILALVGCDIAIVANPDYQYNLELGVMIVICIVLSANVGTYVVQVILAYGPEI